jgi:hypothetical protein
MTPTSSGGGSATARKFAAAEDIESASRPTTDALLAQTMASASGQAGRRRKET